MNYGMSAPTKPENASVDLPPVTEALSSSRQGEGLENRRTNTDRSVDRDQLSQDENASTSTRTFEAPRFKTFSEVVEEVMEASAPPHRHHSLEAEAHQRARLELEQAEGGEIWSEFHRCSHALQKDVELENFINAVQGLGSSLDLAQSTRGLRECLSWTTWLVGENARKLFPQTVPPNHSEPPHVDPEENYEQRRRPTWPPVPTSQSTVNSINTTPVHKNFQALAENIKNLRDVLEQFPEFEDFGKRILRCFEGDLEYWSSCLKKYGDGAESREVQFYIHYLSQDLGNRLSSIGVCVKKYIARVPTVRLSQEHALTNLQTLATIATFFSAVTASTLQFSITNTNKSTTAQVVTTLWFCSLVFSIASALNSSIAFMWRSAVYSSPHKRFHGWLWLWMRQSPTIFLLISVISFLAGLGCFVVSSQPNHIWIVVVICECVSSFSIAALLLLLATDKWSFYLLQQQQRRSGLQLNQFFGGKSASVLPTHVEHTASWSFGYLSRGVQALTSVVSQLKFLKSQPLSRQPLPAPSSVTTTSEQPSAKNGGHLAMSPVLQRWKKVKDYTTAAVSKDAPSEKLPAVPKDALDLEHMARLQNTLQTISVAEGTILHDAGSATSGIQFDPEGRYLAICGKRLTMRYEIESPENEPLRLTHQFGVARQVIWTACGNHIVTRTRRAVHVWSLSETPDRKTEFRYEKSAFILGIPQTKDMPSKFVSIEGTIMNKLAIIDVHGDEERKPYDFGELSIQHVDVSSDGSYLLIAAEVFESPDGLIPMTAPPARKLIVFSLQKFRVEHEVPLWHDVQHVTISRNGWMAIVTYRDGLSPQLWSLRRTVAGMRLSLEHKFSPKKTEGVNAKKIIFSGKGHFLNKDRFVLCTTTAGEIYIWRRDRTEPVHIISQLSNNNDKPLEVACNPTSDDFMFATRSQDGAIRIWKTRGTVLRELPAGDPLRGLSVTTNMLGLHSTSESPVFDPTPLPPAAGPETVVAQGLLTWSDSTRTTERFISHSATLR